ncbi:MAG: hypothetical protein AB7R77_05990 [Ilumatobacteraceae bacterium]
MATDPLADMAKNLRGLAADLAGPGMEKTLKSTGVDAEKAPRDRGVGATFNVSAFNTVAIASNRARGQFDIRRSPPMSRPTATSTAR